MVAGASVATSAATILENRRQAEATGAILLTIQSNAQILMTIEQQRARAARTLAIHGEAKQLLDELLMENRFHVHQERKRGSRSSSANKIASPRIGEDHRSPHAPITDASSGRPFSTSSASGAQSIVGKGEGTAAHPE